MLKHVQAILKSANLDSDDEHRSAYCQLHIGPLTRDLANELSHEMAEALFRLDKIADYKPRMEMASSIWMPKFPLQTMTFRSHTELAQSEGKITDVEIKTLQVIRTRKYPEDFTLAMGISFWILDWPMAATFFERLKGVVALTFEPVGQKRLPLSGNGHEDGKIDRANGRKPLMQVSRHEGGRR